MKKGFLFFSILLFAKIGMAQLPTCNWVTLPASSGGQAYAYSNAYDPSGNSFILGAYQTLNGPVDLDPSSNTVSVNGLGVFVAKYNSSGQMLWAKPIAVNPTSSSATASPRYVACDNQGNVYITGSISNASIDFDLSSTSDSVYAPAGNFDMFFAKYDGSGNLAWGYLIGAAANEEGACIVCDNQSVYLSGKFGCYTDFDPSDSIYVPAIPTNCVAGFIAKYTVDGEFVWEGSLQGITNGPAGYAWPHTIRMDKNKNIIAAGEMGGLADFNWNAGFDTVTTIPNPGSDLFFAKYDTSGNFIYVRMLVTPQYYGSTYMTLDNADNIILAGDFNGTLDTDPSTNVNLLVSANINSNYESDCFIAKYDNSGNLLWSHAMGSFGGEATYAVAVDPNNNILISGQFRDTLDIDFGTGVYTLQATANNPFINDAFVAKYSSAGNLLFGFPMTSLYGNTTAFDLEYNQNKFLLTGLFGDSLDFDPTSATLAAFPFAGTQFYHAEYTDPTVTNIFYAESNAAFSLFPNPSTGALFISNWSDFNSYRIYSISGQLLASGVSSSAVDVNALASGVYVFELIAENGDVHREKFIRQ